ncbi:MAG: NUDIX domain-containing protein [Candidatus Melainabacteria bacterium]|nr:NUDIX domain-containing protein [Candidatus Melainabacteria bacterium]
MTSTDQLTDRFLNEASSLFYSYLEYFPDQKVSFSILKKQFEERDRDLCNRKNMTGHLTASGLLLHPQGNSIFLIHHNFLKLWLQPGGHLDLEENPADGALREFVEETGIKSVALHPWHTKHPFPFDMDSHAIPPNPKKNESDHFHHDYQYLLCLPDKNGVRSGEPLVEIDRNEVSNFRWVEIQEMIEGDYDLRLKRAAGKILKLKVNCLS